MKKLFISVPMKGRKEEDIRKSMDVMHTIAEAVFGQQLEVVNPFVDEYPNLTGVKHSIMCLGSSIQKMADADYFIGPDYCYEYGGCDVERSAASHYGIKIFYIQLDRMDCFKDIFDKMHCKEEVTND